MKLKQADGSCKLNLAELKSDALQPSGSLYEHMVKSTIYIGELYNCGRCERTHAGFAGGVMIGKDGLALTNYHVLQSRNSGKTEGIFAMTWDGKIWPIAEILAASIEHDVAVIRLGMPEEEGSDYQFHAAKIATEQPKPMEPVRIVSHPYGEFFVMTEGEVSRYARMRRPRVRQGQRQVWMEITAPFGSGSSGSGIFDQSGQVVGLVSSIRPLVRDPSKQGDEKSGADKSYVEMLIRMCVPLNAIRSSFADN